MSNQLQITGGAKVRNLQGVITGTSGVLSSVPLGGANGVATLDSGGKVPVSQLPSSVVTYLGTWDAATNTPTLTNGTGDAGDMYICNVAGTVNFGAGPITFAVGDWVLYGSGIWQKSNGQNGTVTSVAVTETGDALTITGSPITTAGTINIGFAGTGSQYIKGDGTLATFPTTINEAKRLVTEVYNESGATLTKGTVVYINGGHGNLPTITKALATSDATSAQTYGVVQTDITNMNNGYVVVIGSLTDLDTQAYANGTQLYLSSTTAGAWTSVKQYAPAHLVYVGIVTRSHPTQGVVEIKIQNGYELDELHNVSAQTPSNNQGLFYNSSNSLWENKSIATALGYTPADNSLVVHLAGTETITGDKTFNGGVDFNNALNINNTFNLRNNLVGSTLYTNFSILKSGSLETLSLLFSTAFSSKLVFNDAANYTYTFPAASGNLVLGSGYADSVAYWNSASGLTYDSTFYYSASNKRLGVNTNTPNATIGANIAIDGGYGLLVKNADNNYNGLGIGIDSTYGNLIASQKLGTASARNVTILNQSGYHSLTEAGSFGLNILTPTASPSGVGSVGIDVYGGSNAAGIGFHNVASGVGNTNGAYIYLTNALSFTLRNLEGTIVSSSLGDFSVITNSTENFRVNASDGSLWQSNITSSLLKTNSSGVIVPAVAGTDYQTPITNPVSGTGTATRVAFWSASNTLSSNTNLYWDNTNARLGIGLTNPQRALEIYSLTADSHLRLSGAAPSVSMGEAIIGSTYQAKFGLATLSNQFVSGSSAGDFVITNQAGNILFGFNGDEKMRITSAGLVGIGTTTTAGVLNLYGAKSQLVITGNTTNGAGILLNNTISGTNRRNWGIFTEQNVDGDFVIKRSDTAGGSATSGTTILSILNTGNVGIGVTPSGTASGYKSLQLATVGNWWGGSGGASQDWYLSNNSYYDGAGLKAIITGPATEYAQVAGVHTWSTAASVSAGAAQTMSERMRITSSGNVGIGTSSPAIANITGTTLSLLQVTNTSNSAGQIRVGGSSDVVGLTLDYNNSGNTTSTIRSQYGSTSDNAAMYLDSGFIAFRTGTSFTERMRITSGGDVLVNTTSTSSGAKFNVFFSDNTNNGAVLRETTGNASVGYLIFNSNGSQTGSITRIGSTNAVAYNTTSDYRLKEDFKEINGLEKISAIKVYDFKWKDNEARMDGVIAHELQEVIPYAVYGKKDALEKDGSIKAQAVDYSKLVPVLVKAIQELKAEIDELKNK